MFFYTTIHLYRLQEDLLGTSLRFLIDCFIQEIGKIENFFFTSNFSCVCNKKVCWVHWKQGWLWLHFVHVTKNFKSGGGSSRDTFLLPLFNGIKYIGRFFFHFASSGGSWKNLKWRISWFFILLIFEFYAIYNSKTIPLLSSFCWYESSQCIFYYLQGDFLYHFLKYGVRVLCNMYA